MVLEIYLKMKTLDEQNHEVIDMKNLSTKKTTHYDNSLRGQSSYYYQDQNSLNISMLIIILKKAISKKDNQENFPSYSPVEHVFMVKIFTAHKVCFLLLRKTMTVTHVNSSKFMIVNHPW